jgi:hypothetical protein
MWCHLQAQSVLSLTVLPASAFFVYVCAGAGSELGGYDDILDAIACNHGYSRGTPPKNENHPSHLHGALNAEISPS